MLYVIRYDTWTIEATDVHDLRDPKFATELEAEEIMLSELENRLKTLRKGDNAYWYKRWEERLLTCQERIQKLKQMI
jgi:hypothetical protein